jgi:cytochrome c oxidase subunit I+III
MHAGGPGEIAQADRARRAAPNGVWGVVMLICSEASLFGTLFGTYFYLRFQSTAWPPAGIEAPALLTPLVLMGVLALTSIPMGLASRAARAGQLKPTRGWLWLALLVQMGYIAIQMVNFLDDVSKFTPSTGYGSAYYVLLGADHIHVYVGILLNAYLLLRLGWGLTAYRSSGVRLTAIYWHFVNILTVFVTFTILTPSL